MRRPGEITTPDPVEILLVEDDCSDADLALTALARARFARRVAWVQDGAEALDFLSGLRRYAARRGMALPRVVLLDLNLPRLDGIQVLRRIRADTRLRLLPVVVFTSSVADRDIAESYAAGANSYIAKPDDPARFRSTIKDLRRYWTDTNLVPAAGTESEGP